MSAKIVEDDPPGQQHQPKRTTGDEQHEDDRAGTPDVGLGQQVSQAPIEHAGIIHAMNLEALVRLMQFVFSVGLIVMLPRKHICLDWELCTGGGAVAYGLEKGDVAYAEQDGGSADVSLR